MRRSGQTAVDREAGEGEADSPSLGSAMRNSQHALGAPVVAAALHRLVVGLADGVCRQPAMETFATDLLAVASSLVLVYSNSTLLAHSAKSLVGLVR